MGTRTHNPAEVALSFGPIEIRGFATADFIRVSPPVDANRALASLNVTSLGHGDAEPGTSTRRKGMGTTKLLCPEGRNWFDDGPEVLRLSEYDEVEFSRPRWFGFESVSVGCKRLYAGGDGNTSVLRPRWLMPAVFALTRLWRCRLSPAPRLLRWLLRRFGRIERLPGERVLVRLTDEPSVLAPSETSWRGASR